MVRCAALRNVIPNLKHISSFLKWQVGGPKSETANNLWATLRSKWLLPAAGGRTRGQGCGKAAFHSGKSPPASDGAQARPGPEAMPESGLFFPQAWLPWRPLSVWHHGGTLSAAWQLHLFLTERLHGESNFLSSAPTSLHTGKGRFTKQQKNTEGLLCRHGCFKTTSTEQ
jgi:hypothetical protein